MSNKDITNVFIRHHYRKQIENSDRGYYKKLDVIRLLYNNDIRIDVDNDNIVKLQHSLFTLNNIMNSIKSDSSIVDTLNKYNIQKPTSLELLMLVSAKDKILNFDKQVNKYNDKYDEYNIDGGFIGKYITKSDAPTKTKMLDYIQFFIDIGGFIPAIGEALDLISAIMSLIRGEYLFALLSFLSMVPVVGDVIGKGIKYYIKYRKATGKSNKDVSFHRRKKKSSKTHKSFKTHKSSKTPKTHKLSKSSKSSKLSKFKIK